MNISIASGLYRYSVANVSETIYHQLKLLYDDALSTTATGWCDFALKIENTSLVRRILRPQRVVNIEGQLPFNPIAPAKLLPTIEWSLNWCVAAYEHQKLILHSSVVAKNGQAILLPAASGSGKTTLATYLGAHGWEMFSDELAVLDLHSNRVNPLFRPASLKNDSINIIRKSCPSVTFSATTAATHKGDIAHAKLYSYEQFNTFGKCPVNAVVFPKYVAQSNTKVMTLSQAEGFASLTRQGFNYNVLGTKGFSTLATVATNSRFYYVEYSDLADMSDLLTEVLAKQC
ncbi:HprK-related kinase A [Alteromonas gilva]|uniref:HprK-related kinase A n=1 Tax=Alteromonas gilva TaxID=2987522 RepID=A0ABT5L008_9ALTE|nr:HprK-related kinase A [Alteromonas gilva]MDC8830352.1 HprK-related kinase A [Alteromonas gilva]